MNATQSTIETISNSSDLLWVLLCKVEDGEITVSKAVVQLSEDDRVIFWEEVADMNRKHRAKLAAAEARKPRPFFDAAEAAKVSRFSYEGKILAAQEARWNA